jgi:MinD-like ATPase involved in chromosome partitioning or flagellar assembly
LTDHDDDRVSGDDRGHGEPQPPVSAAAALASAQRLASAAERFRRGDESSAGEPDASHAADGPAGTPDVPGQDGQPEEYRQDAGEPSGQDPGWADPADTDLIPWTGVVVPRGRRRRRAARAAAREPIAAPPAHASHARPERDPSRLVPAQAAGPAGAQAGPAPGAGGGAELAGQLTPELLLRPRRRAPATGWRRTVYRGSLGLVRVPPGRPELRRLELIGRARTPVGSGHHRVAVLSMKGGVGKTTTTVALGLTLASLRSDRIIALDANPDRGTLADKLTVRARTSVRDMLEQSAGIERYADVRGFTSQTGSRLDVLTSDQSPEAAAAFGEADYCAACAILERFYSVCLTDCGTGLMHSAMAGVLRLADQVILVTTPSLDSARSGGATIDWLSAHGHHDLARNAVVVLNSVRRTARYGVDVRTLEEQFAARCRAVVRIPYDPVLSQGATVELDQLTRPATEAFLALAAAVGDGFARRRPDLELAR